MCMANPHGIYNMETLYRTQIYDICGSYSSTLNKHPDSASGGV